MTTAEQLLDTVGHEFSTSCMDACVLYRLCRQRHSGLLATVLPSAELAELPDTITSFAQIRHLADHPHQATSEEAEFAAALAAAAADLDAAEQVPR